MRDTLHDRLIAIACREDGWRTGNWKAAFKSKCKERPEWTGDLEDNNNGDEIWGDIRFIPDAWRLVVEDENTPGDSWNYPVLVVEFLEIEIDHPIPLHKRRNLIGLWWRFDGTSCFHMRGYRAGRYGNAELWLDADTAVRETDI